jgi:hypothetical protein
VIKINRKNFIFWVPILLLILASCSSQQSDKNDIEESQPNGLDYIEYSQEQMEEIMTAAKKVGVEEPFIPIIVLSGNNFYDVVVTQPFFKIRYDNMIITESNEEVLAGGVIIDQKEITLKNGIKAKWISFSNHKENTKGASAQLYFRINDSYVSVDVRTSTFDERAVTIAESLKPIAELHTTKRTSLNLESKHFSNGELIDLILQGSIHFRYVLNGGKTEEHERFEHSGIHYRFFKEELNTKEKLSNYLKEVYTQEISNQIIKKYNFIEIKGRMALPDADFGSRLDWGNAEVTSIEETQTSIDVKISVPLIGDGETSEYQIKLIYLDEEDWRLAQEIR